MLHPKASKITPRRHNCTMVTDTPRYTQLQDHRQQDGLGPM